MTLLPAPAAFEPGMAESVQRPPRRVAIAQSPRAGGETTYGSGFLPFLTTVTVPELSGLAAGA
jgi:hypothetical protein